MIDEAPDPMTPERRAIAIMRYALRRLSSIDEMAGMGQRDGDPELTTRCRYAARKLAEAESRLRRSEL